MTLSMTFSRTLSRTHPGTPPLIRGTIGAPLCAPLRGLLGALLWGPMAFFLLTASGAAGQGEAHRAGQAFASSRAGDVGAVAKSFNPHAVPGFQTDQPPEAFLEEGALGEAALAASQTQEASRQVYAHARQRQSFRIDPASDPLFSQAAGIIADPQKTLKEHIVEASPADGREEMQTCEESGEETLEEGQEIRMVSVTLQTHRSQLNVYSHGWGGGLARNVVTGQKLDGSTLATLGYSACTELCNPLPEALQSRVKRVKFGFGYTPPSYASLSSEGIVAISTGNGSAWNFINNISIPIEIVRLPTDAEVFESLGGTFQELEERVEKGLCAYERMTILEGRETRVINECPITRDWWRRSRIYRCHYPSLNNCAPLRAQGCHQTGSSCQERVGAVCVVWRQTYRCPSGRKGRTSYRASHKGNPFCLAGDCADSSYEANKEMMSVMSHLYALREAQNDLRNFSVVFKGQHRWCTRNCLNFRDCCGNAKGWGLALHLSACDAQERDLRTLRDKNLCVQVGTYCAERDKIFRACLRKKTAFCCYGTKMARLIQQNARAQWGLGWGSPEEPNCRGLSPDELSRIDFSRVNFSEIFEDVKSHTPLKTQGQSLAEVSGKRLQENMTLLVKPPASLDAEEKRRALKEGGF